MRWYNHLYVGKEASKYRYTIINAIRKKKPRFGTYVITTPTEKNGIMDVIHNAVLLQEFYQTSDVMIIGIAQGRSEAYEVVRDIVDDMYKKNGDFDINAFCNANGS